MRNKIALAVLLLILSVSAGSQAWAANYEVRVTNLTKHQTFTPLLVVSHTPETHLFEAGAGASSELATIAESGNIAPLEALLLTDPHAVSDTNTNGALLAPGETTSIKIVAGGRQRAISLVGMLIPTNDTFVAIDAIPLPPGHAVRQVMAIAYDAGTEANDQNCANIPGPRCGGEGPSDAAPGDEGRIYVSNGFHDLGSADGRGNAILGPFNYDWRNPVARVTIRRIQD